MGDAYQFSETSLPLLDQCVQIAGQPELEWMALFEPNSPLVKSKTLKREDSILSSCSTQIIEYEDNFYDVATDKPMEDVSRQASEEVIENMRANLERKPNQLDYLMKECSNYDNLLPVLAGKLSSSCVEAICNELFVSRPNYIEKFYIDFLAVYLKGNNTYNLELLMKAREAHSEGFKSLIITLLTCETPIPFLENFFTTLDNTERGELLQALSLTNLTPDAFVQHMNPISYLYKTSRKTPEIQIFILNCFISSAKSCCKDKNYGRFLLTYLQDLKNSNAPIKKCDLEQLVNTHETSFTRPCITILNNYK